MSIATDALAQLTDELGQRLTALANAGGTVDDVLAVDGEGERRARRLIGPLTSDDDRESAQAVIDLMVALWPDGTAPPHHWWTTPLGRIVARSIGTDDTDAVTHSVAAAMLGLSRGAIGPMIIRGDLDRHPDGGVLRSSIMARLSR